MVSLPLPGSAPNSLLRNSKMTAVKFNTTGISYREKFPVLDARKNNLLTFNEDLADVVIEVWPSVASIEKRHCAEPVVQIPAHAAILAAKNEYFKALFSNGMAETLEPSQALCTVDTSDEKNIIAQRPKRTITIKGYSVEAVKYFIAHLYDDSEACAAQKRQSLREWEELLRLADEYDNMPLFYMASYVLMDTFLNDPSGESNEHVVTLLNIAYGFSEEMSQILREGCWWYYDQHYLKVLGTEALTQDVKKLQKELVADLFLKMQPKVR
ncbi:hypothetical protein DFS34DRAFT_690553 [Phlyctochytrium arcticum]|nr:hypothetical protein DFS34DRAFT_690553 [Phlyctochytrium arcticum]